ncbi:hypothetical protein [Calderihabitans maritimus]|uniref:Methionine synthase n=1 Tax=Calderihabitans maritimus TaxID=1246530 RepID=A0A1Z5HU68_9FIRM|nr:hypothetical protein [Calderihabitans maritimus]GAW93062.1 hypothetical protein PTH_1873 [Calderihabitans maritimus]
MQFSPPFLATAIGSLPYRETSSALQLIEEKLPEIPHWPQLPKRGKQEHFVFQYLYPLVEMGLIVETGERQPHFDSSQPDWADRLTEFYTLYLAADEGEKEALERFATPRYAAEGFYAFIERLGQKGTGRAKFLKGQIAGPLTVALNLQDQKGKPAYYDPQLRDMVARALAVQARWQAEKLKAFRLPVFIFVDDPGVYAYGSSSFITVTRDGVKEVLAPIVEAIRAAGAIPGAHSCTGIDWSLFIEAGFEVISFDAYNYFDSIVAYSQQIKQFMENGGVLAWGIVPTSEVVLEKKASDLVELWKKQKEMLTQRGISPEILTRQTLITPACGTGTLTPEMAEKIYQLNAEVARQLRGDE